MTNIATTNTTITIDTLENKVFKLNSERTKKTAADCLATKKDIEEDVKNYNALITEKRINALLEMQIPDLLRKMLKITTQL